MLAVFPALLDYSEVAISLLRITAGSFFFLFGIRLTHVAWQVQGKGMWVRVVGLMYGLAKLTAGLLLTFGLYTQIGALLGATLSLLTFSQSISTASNRSGQQVQLLLFVICVSIIFLGPGIIAFDLPL